MKNTFATPDTLKQFAASLEKVRSADEVINIAGDCADLEGWVDEVDDMIRAGDFPPQMPLEVRNRMIDAIKQRRILAEFVINTADAFERVASRIGERKEKAEERAALAKRPHCKTCLQPLPAKPAKRKAR